MNRIYVRNKFGVVYRILRDAQPVIAKHERFIDNGEAEGILTETYGTIYVKLSDIADAETSFFITYFIDNVAYVPFSQDALEYTKQEEI